MVLKYIGNYGYEILATPGLISKAGIALIASEKIKERHDNLIPKANGIFLQFSVAVN
jgi:hypothetical protein